MKNKETYIVLGIVVASIIVLAGLFIYQKGQKVTLETSLQTKDGLKISLNEAQFRPVNDNYKDIIIKAILENTTSKTVIPFSVPQHPSDPDNCYSYSQNSNSTYNNNVNTNINSTTSPATGTEPTIPAICQQYFEKDAAYQETLNNYDSKKKSQQFKLYTPSGSVAEADYYQIGGKKDLINYVNSEYGSLEPNEKINGVFVFKITDSTAGTYRITYKGSELTFNIK